MSYLSKFYDLYNLGQKNNLVTEAEAALIQTLVAPPADILDVGCGTGRHLIPLSQIGYQLTGIDNDPEMLEQAKKQLPPQVELVQADITKLELPHQFDLIISMWNAFNEYALDEETALTALGNMQKLLKSNGQILLNIEDAEKLKPEQLNFTQHHSQDGLELTHTSTLVSFTEVTQISHCREQLEVKYPDGRIEHHEGELIQKWWLKSQIAQLAAKADLRLLWELSITPNQELYLVLQ